MCSIENINDKATKLAFDKRVISATQQIHPYVKHRLYIAESMRIIPKNMYSSNGVIDESIAQFYENGFDIDSDVSTIRIKLFKIVSSYLDSIFKKEAFHKNTISTRDILEEELDAGLSKYQASKGTVILMLFLIYHYNLVFHYYWLNYFENDNIVLKVSRNGKILDINMNSSNDNQYFKYKFFEE